ncbi:hypothetical protein KC19_11G044200 [Ceratodon purpureus]|uniref:TIR domain-containing protein n=1 Tax=Ceratodon purpureus TaxID=3225 RepID=A0A8T0GAX6_CERPU|nr:hypothetical protein KC19_11G044200 [Ceratodon purpureus]
MTKRPIEYSEADVHMRDVEMRSRELENIRPLGMRADESLLLQTQRIFLSHSGSQKDFVEQLHRDLKNCGHTLFFDKSTESLPKGRAFPQLILQAARQCLVAVVVLSDQYFMSKWPMLELIAFVEARRTCNSELHILPLFYKLDVCDLKDIIAIRRWKAEWENFAAMDDRFDPNKCEDALRALIANNGERFCEYGGSKVRYREAIVAIVYQLSRPYLKYDTPPMVAGARLCQIVIGELERQNQVNGGRPAVVGLSGIGGMGKTLLCKALCNRFREEFAGRVCHVECSKSSSSLELQKLILDELTDANKSYLHSFKTSEEVLDRICDLLPQKAVFLAVDNVQEGDLQWLQRIFNRQHKPKSKFVVTARCLSNVQAIVKENALCQAMPSLTEEEALELFIRSAVPTPRLRIPPSYFTDKILKDCIEECFFYNDMQDCRGSRENSGGHYNPMLLQILGFAIKDSNPSQPQHLIEKCRMWGKLQHFHKHPLFEILRTEYDALHPPRCKQLFFDIALFAPREKLRKLDDLCTWLEGMYDTSREEILHMLRKLRKSSLIEDWETNAKSQITLHELYKDFAAYELREVEADKRSAVYHKGGLSDLPQNLESSPPGRNWPDLGRVSLRIENKLPGDDSPQPDLYVLQSIVLTSPPVMFPDHWKIQEWENLQLLCLEGFESKELDISPLKRLRHLKLVSYELRTLRGCDQLKQLRFVELNCSGLREGLNFSRCSKLQELVTGEIYSLQELCLPRSPSDLKILKLRGWNKRLPVELDLGRHRQLRKVAIYHTIWDTGRSSLWGNWSLTLTGLQFLTSLVGLKLIGLPITSLPGLQNLVGLEFLNLRGCAKLEVLPDLSGFSRLARIDRNGCKRLPLEQPLVASSGCTRIIN